MALRGLWRWARGDGGADVRGGANEGGGRAVARGSEGVCVFVWYFGRGVGFGWW